MNINNNVINLMEYRTNKSKTKDKSSSNNSSNDNADLLELIQKTNKAKARLRTKQRRIDNQRTKAQYRLSK